jgi:hypothetical protein
MGGTANIHEFEKSPALIALAKIETKTSLLSPSNEVVASCQRGQNYQGPLVANDRASNAGNDRLGREVLLAQGKAAKDCGATADHDEAVGDVATAGDAIIKTYWSDNCAERSGP